MSGSNDSDRMLGLSPSDERILLYGILCPSTDGSRNAIDYMKLASVLGYTPSSAKVMYGNARRKLARFTGMEVPIIARGNMARGTAAAGSKTTTDAPETDESPAKKPRKTSPTTSRKRKAEKLETTQTEGVAETHPQIATKTQAGTETQAETKIEAKAKSEVEAKAETDVEAGVHFVPEHKKENGEAEEEVVKTETGPSEAKEEQS